MLEEINGSNFMMINVLEKLVFNQAQ